MPRAIYDNDRLYNFVTRVLRMSIIRSFRHYEVSGKDKICYDNGRYILITNHCAALMDPLALLTIDSKPKVIVSRSDIYKGSFLKRFFAFAKMMPINRRRDGLHSVAKANETIDKAIEALNHDTPFCILPEGRHRALHSLMDFGKGLSRTAYGAHVNGSSDKDVYIVPVGCEYGDFFRYRSSLLLNVGNPINVSQYIRDNEQKSEAVLLGDIRLLAWNALRDAILYIPDDEDYDAVWALTRIGSGHLGERQQVRRLEYNKKLVERILKYKQSNPEDCARLFERVRNFEMRRKAAKISLKTLGKRGGFVRAMLLSLASLLLLPVFAVSALITLPLWVLAEYLSAKFKDKAWRISLHACVFLLLWNLPLLPIALVLPAPYFVYDYFELVRQCASSWRNVFDKSILKEYEKIYSTIDSLPVY